VAKLPTSLDDSQEMSDDDTISSLFPEVVEFVMDLGVELEDSITDMLAINSDDHPVVSMNLQVIMGSNDPLNQSKQTLNYLQLITTSDASATVLPYDRGPVKVPTVSTGSLKSLPFHHGKLTKMPGSTRKAGQGRAWTLSNHPTSNQKMSKAQAFIYADLNISYQEKFVKKPFFHIGRHFAIAKNAGHA
jgi:hypothetical protein